MIEEQRPLSFYPYAKKKRLFIGSKEKNTIHDIVPFEFVGKKLYYGLTATGTSDLNPMPFDPRYPMVGLHANALNTILDNKIIYEVPKTHVALIIIAIWFITIIWRTSIKRIIRRTGNCNHHWFIWLDFILVIFQSSCLVRYGWAFIYIEHWLSWDNSVQLYSGREK